MVLSGASSKVRNKPPQSPSPSPRWVCVELSSNGEREKDISMVVRAVRQILGRHDIEVFMPAISQKVRGESHTMVYMDGYIFIRFCEGVSYLRLQDTTYFRSVLCTGSGTNRKNLSLLEDKMLDSMRKGVQKLKFGQFTVGDDVKVIKGDYKNLIGKITEIYDEENVQVSVPLCSKRMMIDYPVSYLMKVLR